MMKHLRLLIIFLSFNLGYASAQSNLNLTIEHDGLTRDYRLHLPPQYTDGASLPMVFNLHGNTSNAFQQEFYTDMNTVADDEGFIVCHPEGTDIDPGNAAAGKTWNVSFAGGSTADDAGFLSTLIDAIHVSHSIDLTRVYSTGMSNGGYMSYKMACEFTDRIAAIASVTGSMVPIEVTNCNPSKSIPVMQIHGTLDPVVPYAGAAWTTGIENLVAWWVTENNCTDAPVTTAVDDTNDMDGSTAGRILYSGCNGGVTVEFYKVTGGGHTWPDGVIDLPGSGNTNRDFNATQVIWDFFLQYSNPDAVPVKDVYNSALEIDVFPNPAIDVLNINNEGLLVESVRIYNLLGQEVANQTFDTNLANIEIPITDFNKGTYVIKIETAEGFVTKKFIKG